jgi:hypothetical protein
MATPTPEFSEKDFIQEGFKKNPLPFWVWFFLLTAFVSLLWGGASWYYSKVGALIQRSPFLQVTNRELSLFLWQNPEFMRVNVPDKSNYLPGFQYLNKVTLELANADDYVIAPPELLFRYHTWHRLVGNEFSPRPIPIGEFREFLKEVEEWQPKYWPKAPPEYVKFVEQELPNTQLTHLEILSPSVLPQEVRMAFQGWKNYFKEGEKIDQVQPTVEEMKKFLAKNPHYARNYWRNIVEKTVPNYLRTFSMREQDPKSRVPSDEMSPFLKVAIYNFLMMGREGE